MKEETKDGLIMFAILLVILGVVGGLRIVWAKYVYHDTRCAWAECRIQVNP